MKESFMTKYKPYKIDNFYLDVNVKEAIKTFIDMDELNIMIYGNHDTGKTMLVESIVREYYGLDNYDNLPETNVLYINNLKEPGVQFYRNEMKTFCLTKCTIKNKKKIVLLDDIDNINEQSQQVFRNYIDRYKNNVHFLSVCTNIQKVIESLQSRVHIIQLKYPTKIQINDYIQKICDLEKIDMNSECKNYIIKMSNNSLRMISNYLEKIQILNLPIDIELCKEACSNISIKHFEEYLHFYNNNDLSNGIGTLYTLYNSGYSVIDILDFFFLFIKGTDKLPEDVKYKMIPFLCKYITIFHTIHEDPIELALFTNSLFNDLK
jgi:DNA polymerase III delta prime subunit